MKKIVTSLIFLTVFAIGLIPSIASAQEVYQEEQAVWKARVTNILEQETREIPGTDTSHIYQTLEAEILEGPQKGEVVTIENDYLELREGKKFYVSYIMDIDGIERYSVLNVYRLDALIFFIFLFIVAVVALGGWQGVRSLFALAGSFFIILYVLMPGLLQGWNPFLSSFLVAAGILFAAIFFTHGFNRASLVAYGGTVISVILTAILAYVAVTMTDLTGFASDEAVYLNFNTQGSLNFTGLLLGAIVIGVLGVLDDIAITQTAVVTELYGSNKDFTKKDVFIRSLRVGREHVGALVNTLVLAYTGAALPTLLFFYSSPTSFSSAVNMELFATEIIRTIVGSIGLIMTVPIVTFLAVVFLKGHTFSHSHGHSHHSH